MRRAVDRLQRRLVRCPDWDGVHHEVFEAFPPWRGESDGTRALDFLGGRTDPKLRAWLEPTPAGPAEIERPLPCAAYFEWIALLRSIAEAQRRYAIVELGAAYGPWLAYAWHACRRRARPSPV